MKNHIVCAIGKRVIEFEDPIYFVVLLLHPLCKTMAMSRSMIGDKIIQATLKVVKVWHFSKRDVVLLYKELINYKNGDAPFDDFKDTCNNRSTREFWENFFGGLPLLRRFATNVFSIVPHSGPCERLFSIFGLVKSKPRNRLEVERLNMLGQIRYDLASEVCIKKPKSEDSQDVQDGLSMGDFDVAIEDGPGNDLLDEKIEEVRYVNEANHGRFFQF
ncbi:hypothetical protein FRX31_003398 [Thalictrum thalictroides]|uniref:HAT C-terminal dimerisation domain-containing protein n=1 Tax=Thalictrum thalictroides TaxID=46969 RepID=A0A7J6XBZ1_THATH|nr:hypothetical protein FRX31_003398 [Thalictrum thalictroides]